MPKLIIMSGLQGSGKSTYATKLCESMPNAVLLSSDDLRQNVGSNGKIVFEILYRLMNSALENGQDVIFDATNVKLKDRRPIYSSIEIDPNDLELEIVLMTTPYDECLRRVEERNRAGGHYVPLNVVEKYLYEYQVPLQNEPQHALGKPFDKMSVVPEKKEFNPEKYAKVKNAMNKFNQKTPMHSSALGAHCDEVLEHYAHYKDDKMHKQFALLHDYGKMFTQTFDEQRRAHYYSHENVGAYRLLSNDSDLIDLDNQQEFLGMIALVNYHMMPFGWTSPKANKKWAETLGDDLYKDLIEFNVSDQVRQ